MIQGYLTLAGRIRLELGEIEQVVSRAERAMRFRHVVRNSYAFQFDPKRIERLVNQMRPTFVQAQSELLAFSTFLEHVGRDE